MMEKEVGFKLNIYLKKKLKKLMKKPNYKEDSKERYPRIPRYISWHDLRFFDFPFSVLSLNPSPNGPITTKKKDLTDLLGILAWELR